MVVLRGQYDPLRGGFGGAPKFPPASAVEFLLRRDGLWESILARYRPAAASTETGR